MNQANLRKHSWVSQNSLLQMILNKSIVYKIGGVLSDILHKQMAIDLKWICEATDVVLLVSPSTFNSNAVTLTGGSWLKHGFIQSI